MSRFTPETIEGWFPQSKTDVLLESVGTVMVSTVRIPESWSAAKSFYWETALIFPNGDIDIVDHAKSAVRGGENHAAWSEAERIARYLAEGRTGEQW